MVKRIKRQSRQHQFLLEKHLAILRSKHRKISVEILHRKKKIWHTIWAGSPHRPCGRNHKRLSHNAFSNVCDYKESVQKVRSHVSHQIDHLQAHLFLFTYLGRPRQPQQGNFRLSDTWNRLRCPIISCSPSSILLIHKYFLFFVDFLLSYHIILFRSMSATGQLSQLLSCAYRKQTIWK